MRLKLIQFFPPLFLILAIALLFSSDLVIADNSVLPQFFPPWEVRGAPKDPNVIQKRLFPNILLPSLIKDKKEAEREAFNYFKSYSDIIDPLSLKDLSFKWSTCVRGKKLSDSCHVDFYQQVSGVEVAGSHVSMMFKAVEGKSKLVFLTFFISPDAKKISISPKISDKKILKIARDVLARVGQDKSRGPLKIDKKTIRYVEPKLRLIIEVKPTNNLRVFVDGETGEAWVGDDRIYEIFEGIVRGRLDESYDGSSPIELDTLPLQNLTVQPTGRDSVYTDNEGHFLLNIEEETEIRLNLQGRWVSVMNISGYDETLPLRGITMSIIENILPTDGSATYTFNPEGLIEELIAQTNAYYHVNLVHSWLRDRGIGEEIDFPIPAFVNIPEVCNAYYDPDEVVLGFYHSGTRYGGIRERWCINTAIDEVIYHEYGHFVDDMTGGTGDRAMSEGWGDLIAAFILGDPEAEFTGRNADNRYCYGGSRSYFAVHDDGKAWSGFGWDIRRFLIYGDEELGIPAMGESDGIPLAEELLIRTLAANPFSMNDGVLIVLLLDDDNGDLSDGTPHFSTVREAAMRHCLDLGGDYIAPGEITDLAASDFSVELPYDPYYPDHKIATVLLSWTAPGDDGTIGTVSDYYFAYSINTPFEEEDYVRRTVYNIRWMTPHAAGSTESVRVPLTCAVPEATYYIVVRAHDENNLSSSISNVATIEIPQDTYPPRFSRISVSGSSDTSVNIQWFITDRHFRGPEVAVIRGHVDYGTSESYGNTESGEHAFSFTFPCNESAPISVSLSDITPHTIYHYRIRSSDAYGNEAASDDQTFVCSPNCQICKDVGEAPGAYGVPGEQCCPGLEVSSGGGGACVRRPDVLFSKETLKAIHKKFCESIPWLCRRPRL